MATKREKRTSATFTERLKARQALRHQERQQRRQGGSRGPSTVPFDAALAKRLVAAARVRGAMRGGGSAAGQAR